MLSPPRSTLFPYTTLFRSTVALARSPSKAVANRAPLRPNTYNLLPLGAIEPRGWLRKQLEIQASGLTGHLDEFWKDVGNKDRKSTRLNSSHRCISYAVFCL